MKRHIVTTLFSLILSLSLAGQAKKPVLMVIPSESFCERSGYVTTYTDETGTSRTTPDYRSAVAGDENLRLVISELAKIMAERGFPLKDMEHTLKSIATEEAEIGLLTSKSGAMIVESPLDQLKRTARADIILDIDFSVKSRGPQKYISFNLRGLDAYTGKIITAASGDGMPSSYATPGLLMEEAVLNYMDGFNAALMEHFNDMFENGREATITLRLFDTSPVQFDEPYMFQGEEAELSDIINWWMDENAINHRFSRTTLTENVLKYEQVRIPLFKKVLGKERATDTRGYVQGLAKFLQEQPFCLPCRIYEKGLGEAWLIIGD